MDASTRRRLHEQIVRLADGDRRVFASLFEELWPVLLRFVTQALRDSPDAQDVAQQALIKICYRAAEFDTSRDGVSWAFGVASWEVRTHLRTRQRRRETNEADLAHLEMPGDSHEDVLIQDRMKAALAEIIQDLPAQDREALLGRGPDLPDRSPATATQRKRRQRALERLREMWRHRYE